ncbi:MAG: hypothetical protein H7Y04_07295 [Verrucomicrobia bacterium]|nr:hypothetical protein [Cytophagales bacterium]
MYPFNLWQTALTVVTALLIWWLQRVVVRFEGYEKRLNALESDLRQNTLQDQNNLKAILERMDLLLAPVRETLQRIEREVENLRGK